MLGSKVGRGVELTLLTATGTSPTYPGDRVAMAPDNNPRDQAVVISGQLQAWTWTWTWTLTKIINSLTICCSIVEARRLGILLYELVAGLRNVQVLGAT